MRLSVTHWRVLIVLGNLTLTGLVAGHVVYRALHGLGGEENKIAQKIYNTDPDEFQASGRATRRAGGEIFTTQVARIGSTLDPEAPPPPPPPPPPENLTDPGDLVQGEGEEKIIPDGPLKDHYEYISAIYFGPGDEDNRVILEPPKPETPTRTTRGRTVIGRPGTIRRPPPSTTRRRTTTAGRGAAQTVIYLFGEIEVEEGDVTETYWLIDISPERIVYRDQKDKQKYSLDRKTSTIYRDGRVDPPTEETDEEEGEEGEKEVKHFVLDAPLVSRRDNYESVMETGETLRPESGEEEPAPATSGVRRVSPSSARTSSSLRRSPTRTPSPAEKREQLKKLGSTLKKIDESKLDAKDREALKELKGMTGGSEK